MSTHSLWLAALPAADPAGIPPQPMASNRCRYKDKLAPYLLRVPVVAGRSISHISRARRPPSGDRCGCSRFGAQLAVEAAGAPVGVEQTEQVQRNERVGERGHEVIGRVVALHDELANVAPRGAEHEERPADGGRQPESAEEHA